MSTRTLVLVIGVGAACSLAMADMRFDPPLIFSGAGNVTTGGSFSTSTVTWSTHKGPNSNALPKKASGIFVKAETSASGRTHTDSAGKEYIENYYIRAWTKTPFCGKIGATSKFTHVQTGGTGPGGRKFMSSEANAEADWEPSRIIGAHNTWEAVIGNTGGGWSPWGADPGEANSGEVQGYAAHDVAPISVTLIEPQADPDAISALITDIRTGGWLARDSSGNLTFDANGEVLWDVPPSVSLRFTSSVASATGGGVQYTYRIDNFMDIDFSFAVPEATTPGFPNGWTGDVSADDYAEISFTDTLGEYIYSQRSQTTYTDDDDEALLGAPVRLYAPSSRKGYSGTVSITSITETAPGTNTIRFTISGEVADGAVVTRDLDGIGTPLLVEEVDGPLLPGTEYVVLDNSAAAGLHSYRVRVGRDSNSATSETVEVTNQ